jgi:membrane fusion protein (multidrug efflux system)
VAVFPTALDGVRVPATVKYVAGAIREQTRDLVIEAELAEKDARLRPGMSVRVELEVGRTPAVVVPEAALRMIEGAPNLFVVREGVAVQRVVRVGARADGDVAVLSDLAEGDVVIVDPPADLRDGARVN